MPRFPKALALCALALVPCGAHLAEPAVQVLSAEAGLFGPPGTEPGSFVPGARLPLKDGQVFGWRIRLRTTRPEVTVHERLTLPAEPRTWGDPEPDIPRRTSADGRSAESIYRKRPVDGLIWHTWQVTQGDPRGTWTLTLRVEQASPVVLRLQAQ